MKTIRSDQKRIIIRVGFLLAGLFVGWLLFSESEPTVKEHKTNTVVTKGDDHQKNVLWTCAMHPQIREEGPGNCPICDMELVPLESMAGTPTNSLETEMSPQALELADIQTSVVSRATPEKTIYMPGRIKADERRIETVTSRFPGRIEKLYVDFTGQEVTRGQRLAAVYSPELVTAQKELFEAKRFKETNPSFYTAAVNKLKLWDLTESQIQALQQNEKPMYNFDIRSKQSGTVLKKTVAVGDYLKQGQPLFQIAGLNSVWVTFDAYESDLAWINVGDTIQFTVRSLPGKTFKSAVTFIDPVIDPNTRVATVRTQVMNTDGALKPDMFAQGIARAGISKIQKAITIPKSAILWTGKRAVVYVKKQHTKNPVFEFRQIDLGADAGEYYIVESGLEEGEEIVTNGTFKIDAAAQLMGKASMMAPEAGMNRDSMPGMNMGDRARENEKSEGLLTNKYKILEGNLPDFRGNLSVKFSNKLNLVFEAYLSLKDALVSGDNKAANSYSSSLLTAVKNVDGSMLEQETGAFWEERKSVLKKYAKICLDAQTIADKRNTLLSLSQPLIQLAEAYGPGVNKLYIEYCPMANMSNGGFWLSRTKKIENPFMGNTMISCGEVKREIAAN